MNFIDHHLQLFISDDFQETLIENELASFPILIVSLIEWRVDSWLTDEIIGKKKKFKELRFWD